jgi:hypothetical protein
MEVREEQEKVIKLNKVVGYKCNKCGKYIDDRDGTALALPDTIHEFVIQFGYNSSYDCEKWEFHLCEDCLVEFAKSFAIPPEINNYMTDIYVED